MKKLSLLVLALFCCTLGVLASNNIDIIVKTNSEKIEALIQEVSETELRFKKANNPNGPTFVLKMEDISSILYANGEVQAIEHKARPAENNNAYGYRSYNTPVEGHMMRTGNDTYRIGDKNLSGKELEFFLQQNCPQAYTFYKNQKNMEIAGWSLLGAGIPVCLVVGLTSLFCSSSYEGEIAGCVFIGLGGGMMLASVPMIACGNINKKRVDEVYNLNCTRRISYKPELKMTSGQNGLGFAIAW